jgi:GNAT superfamily N-acetyltransferase
MPIPYAGKDPSSTSHPIFPLVDRYLSTVLDIDLAALGPGDLGVTGSPRRLRPEKSYAFIHALYGLWLKQGQIAVSVPPAAYDAVRESLSLIPKPEPSPELAQRLTPPIDSALIEAGLSPTSRTSESLLFACNGALLRHRGLQAIRLQDESLPPAAGLSLPVHCFPDGIVYGLVIDACVVSVAYAHRTGLMASEVADLGVETAPAYRRRGYAGACVAAITAHIASQGGEALYGCSPQNTASAATARSAGYVPYARTLILVANDT